ncbi:MAG TPA: cytochrome c oxidase assembly protein [Streptosporangiaceae bacterium]
MHPAPLTWHTLLTTWRPAIGWDVVILGACAGYLVLVRRTRGWPGSRTAAFLTGLAALAITLNSSIAVYAHPLFWVHMIEHLLLIMVVPVLLIAGQPLRLAGRRARRFLRSPPVAVATSVPAGFAGYTAVITGTHLTSFMQAMLTHPWIHQLEIVLYLAGGLLFFLPLIAHEPLRWTVPYPLRMGILMLAMSVDTFVGLTLMLTTSEPWPGYATMRRSWQPTPLADLHGGGAIMWVGGDALMFVLILVIAFAWATDHDRRDSLGGWLDAARAGALAGTGGDPGARTGGAPAEALLGSTDIDTDASALDAYNRLLADLAKRDGRDSRGG